jgi:hypothetical protein
MRAGNICASERGQTHVMYDALVSGAEAIALDHSIEHLDQCSAAAIAVAASTCLLS